MRHFLFLYVLCITLQTSAQFVVQVNDKSSHKHLSNVYIEATWQNEGERINRRIYITNILGKAELDEEAIKANARFTFSLYGYDTLILYAGNLVEYNYQVSMSRKTFLFNEITVSANKFSENLGDIPRQVLVISKNEIDHINPSNSAFMLEQTGQVFVQRSQLGGGSPVLRGFEANKILLVIDGIRMNNAIYRSGHLQNVLRIDPMLLNQAEVLFGSGSVIYGSDALGGVIHFTSMQPEFSKTKKFEAKSGFSTSFQSATNFFSVHSHISLSWKKWSSLTSISFGSFDDLTTGKNRASKWESNGIRDSFVRTINGMDTILRNANNTIQTPSGYNQTDLLQKIRYKANKYWDLTLNLQYSNSSNVSRFDRLSEINPSTNRLRFAEWNYGPELRTLSAIHIHHSKKTLLSDTWITTFGYQYIEESRHSRNIFAPNRTNRYERVGVFTLNSDIEKTIGKNELRYGVEYTYNRVSSSANLENISTGMLLPQSTRYPDGGSTMQQLAAYVNNAFEWSEKWVWNGGLRYSLIMLESKFIDKTFVPFLPTNSIIQQNAALNGQLGVVFKYSSTFRLYAQLSSGFRAPNVDDMGKVFESAAGTQVVVPNNNLQPEFTYNSEFGFNLILYKRIRWDNAIWATRVVDAITLLPAQLIGNDSILFEGQLTRVLQQQNAQDAYLYGFSSGIEFELTKWISLNGRINYTHGRILTDTINFPLDHIPPIYGQAGLTGKYKTLRYDVFTVFHGSKKLKDYNQFGEDNLQYATSTGTPSWYTLHAKVTWQFKIQQQATFQFTVGIDNILDAYYRVFASGISAPGRNLQLAVRAYF